MNISALQSLQDLLNQYDLSNLSEEDQAQSYTLLQQNGFLNTGNVCINLRT